MRERLKTRGPYRGRISPTAVLRAAHRELLPPIWELRENLSAYDADYVAVGEALHAPVLTCDAKLAHSPAHRARIELVA